MIRHLNKLFLLLSFCCSFTWALPKDTPIVIVGAGAAGISALSRLIENNYTQVTLLEAENRIGGRIHTVPFASNVIDLGAQWVHGENGNIIWEMSRGQNLLNVTPEHFFGGWLISSETRRHSDYVDLFELCEYIFWEMEGCEELWGISYGNYFINVFNAEMGKIRWQHILPQNRIDFIRFYEKLVNLAESSDSWLSTSVSGCSERVLLPGEYSQNWKELGFHTMFDFITRKRPDPSRDLRVESRIRLNQRVSEIDYTNSATGFIRVRTTDGTIYNARHVIVTVSIGVLKAEHRTMFRPNLPRFKINSIEAIQFGTLDKIALEFQRPFWSDSWPGFSLIWTPQGLARLSNTRFGWTRGLIGFWRVSYQPNVLNGWIVGPEAREMERLSNADILSGVMYVFNEFLRGIINFTTPIRILPSRWDSNPNFRGSYSSRSVETDLRDAWAYDMAIPINNTAKRPVILFAGEDTHPEFYSYAHGAVESGYREADRLMRLS